MQRAEYANTLKLETAVKELEGRNADNSRILELQRTHETLYSKTVSQEREIESLRRKVKEGSSHVAEELLAKERKEVVRLSADLSAIQETSERMKNQHQQIQADTEQKLKAARMEITNLRNVVSELMIEKSVLEASRRMLLAHPSKQTDEDGSPTLRGISRQPKQTTVYPGTGDHSVERRPREIGSQTKCPETRPTESLPSQEPLREVHQVVHDAADAQSQQISQTSEATTVTQANELVTDPARVTGLHWQVLKDQITIWRDVLGAPNIPPQYKLDKTSRVTEICRLIEAYPDGKVPEADRVNYKRGAKKGSRHPA
ncbi:hypothetical protein BD626DRAFT_539193 [Schizophyllum amplum]|uniref:Uncharacterized protein n=1 Tax=Schizophyllum amplum TaxID=97359 RepID=A0A550C4M5_9AGAR|nr:hypothetical protein BD626DRAFT_539193 [Auriculariopsis ampla]